MYIEKQEENGKIKYFLSHSYREGKKVHKFRKYLGIDLTKAKLEERQEIAEKLILEEIHKHSLINNPLTFELTNEDLKFIKEIEKEIPLKINHLSQNDWKTFSKLFTYNTNAIEGSTLNKKEVQNLLDENKWPNKSKEDIAETFGVDEAINFIRQTKEHISIKLIKEIHKIVFKNSKDFAGKFRKKGEDVVVLGQGGNIVHEGASPSRINHLLKELIFWYEENTKKYPPIVLACVIHNQFENIHPFADGNGRVGRILLNNILIKHNLPPLNINLENRFEYYRTLQEFDKKHNLKPTLELFLKEYKKLKKDLDK